MSSSFDVLQQLQQQMQNEKSPMTTGADVITSLNLLKQVDPGATADIERIQKNEAKYLLAGIRMLNGPKGGQLQDLLGSNGFEAAQALGGLFRQNEARKLFETTMNAALEDGAYRDLGFDQPTKRADALNTFVKRK